MLKLCKNCRYFFPSSNIGHCHRFPPKATQAGNSAFYPVVESHWPGCGEFREIEDKKVVPANIKTKRG